MVPTLAEPRLLLANCMERLHHPAAAIEQLTAVAEADPANHEVTLRLAQLLLNKGESARARAYLDQVLQSAHPVGLENRPGRLAAGAVRGTGAPRPVSWRNCAGLARHRLRDTLALAGVYRQQKDLPRLELLIQELMHDPDQEVVQFAIDCYLAQGRQPEAEKALDLLVPLTSDKTQVLLSLADVYGRTGQPDLRGSPMSPRPRRPPPVRWHGEA